MERKKLEKRNFKQVKLKLDQMKELYARKIAFYENCYNNVNSLIEKNDKEQEELIDLLSKIQEYLKFFKEEEIKINEIILSLEKLEKEQKNTPNSNGVFVSGKEIQIVYFGKLYKEDSAIVNITYGFGTKWDKTSTIEMDRKEYGFITSLKIEDFDTVNVCFSNDQEEWDNNNGINYTFPIFSEDSEIPSDKEKIFVGDNKEIDMQKFAILNEKIKEMESDDTNALIYEENFFLEYIDNQMKFATSNNNEEKECKIKDNGVLLISEIQNKVLLPYTGKEVEEILETEKDKYQDAESVINDKFTRPLSDYKDLHMARVRETFKLLTQVENYSILDATTLAAELFGKRYLHPAIISACKSLDELDVYLDCLDKNELDDFKIFEIKYEIYPTIVKENKLYIGKSIIQKILDFIRKMFFRKGG